MKDVYFGPNINKSENISERGIFKIKIFGFNLMGGAIAFLIDRSVTPGRCSAKSHQCTAQCIKMKPKIVSIPECDEYIRIFEYIGHEYIIGHSFVSIFLLRIYSDIRSCQICLYEYIRTFVGECVRV